MQLQVREDEQWDMYCDGCVGDIPKGEKYITGFDTDDEVNLCRDCVLAAAELIK